MKKRLPCLRISKNITGATIFVISSFLQRGLSLITTPLFTRLLSTHEYGILANYNTWSGVLSVIFTLSIAANAFSKGLVNHKEDRDCYISNMLGVTAATVGIGFLLVTLFKSTAAQITGIPYHYFVVLFLNLFCGVAYGFWGLQCKFDGKYIRVVVANLGLAVLSIVMSVLALCFMDYDPAFVKIVSGSVPSVVFALMLTVHYIKKAPAFFIWKYWKEVLLFCIPLIPHYMASHLLNQSDRIMITAFCGPDKTAIYTIANKIPELVNIFWSCISAVFVPWLYNHLDKDQHKEIRKINTILIGMVSLIALCSSMLAPEIMHILAPEVYQEGKYLVPILIVGYSGSFVCLICSHIELFMGKNYFITIITVICATFNIVLNWIFIPRFGYMAAAYTTYIGYAVMLVLHYYNIVRLKMTRYLHFPLAVLMFVINSGLGLLMLGTYEKTGLRYGIVFAVALITACNYKIIIRFIRQLKGR